MDANFWHQRWQDNQIGFHQSEANPLLVSYFDKLSLGQGSRVFVPLCGKTLDIGWLLSNGYRVAGAELSELAIRQLFEELGVAPEIEIMEGGNVKHYRAPDLDIFVGDIFDVTRQLLGPIDAIYDRAALIALPEDMRIRYAQHLIEITDNAPQLLITLEYDQNLRDGPPFSIGDEAVRQYYKDCYDLSPLTRVDAVEGLRGVEAVQENVWLLKPLTL